MRYHSKDVPSMGTEKDTRGKRAAKGTGEESSGAMTRGGRKKVTKNSLREVSFPKSGVYILYRHWNVFSTGKKKKKRVEHFSFGANVRRKTEKYNGCNSLGCKLVFHLGLTRKQRDE